MITRAAKLGARLMVLPELCDTGYMFQSPEEACGLSEPVPQGACSRAWIEIAAREGVYLCAGIAEREGEALYNSVMIAGPGGFIGKYRKMHLWDREKLWFKPGNLGFPVFDLPFGRIACRICYDVWFPESTRILALQGADIICDSTNWVDAPPLQTKSKPTAAHSAAQMSLMNAVYTICADRVGAERGAAFIGNSCIIDPDGNFSAGPASPDHPEILLADINLEKARNKARSEHNSVFGDRRTDFYGSLLGYGGVDGDAQPPESPPLP